MVKESVGSVSTWVGLGPGLGGVGVREKRKHGKRHRKPNTKKKNNVSVLYLREGVAVFAGRSNAANVVFFATPKHK